MDTQIQAASSSVTRADALTHAAASPILPQRKEADLKPTISPVKETPTLNKEQEHSKVAEALAKIEKFVAPMASELQFSIDEESGVRVVKVYDRATNEVIRQIPSAEMLEIAKALDRLQGILLRQKA